MSLCYPISLKLLAVSFQPLPPKWFTWILESKVTLDGSFRLNGAQADHPRQPLAVVDPLDKFLPLWLPQIRHRRAPWLATMIAVLVTICLFNTIIGLSICVIWR